MTHSWFLAIPVPIQQALHQVSVNSSLTANFLYDRTCFGGGACRRRQGSQGEPAAGSLLSGRWPPARYWLPPAWLAATCAAACSLQRAALAAPTVGRPPPASGVASRRSSGWRPLVRLAAAGAAGMPAPAANCCRPPADGVATGRCSSAAAAGRGDPGASSTTGLAARSGLGDRCCGDLAACWSSMGRRRTARVGGTGGRPGTGGRGGDDGDGDPGYGSYFWTRHDSRSGESLPLRSDRWYRTAQKKKIDGQDSVWFCKVLFLFSFESASDQGSMLHDCAFNCDSANDCAINCDFAGEECWVTPW